MITVDSADDKCLANEAGSAAPHNSSLGID